MSDHADDNNDDYDGDDIFIYRGGRAPLHITHARIDRSVDEIEEDAFKDCERLLAVDTHDGLQKVGYRAFDRCIALRHINLKAAVFIGAFSFSHCTNLLSVEFGDRLEIIAAGSFTHCSSLQHLKMPSIISIGLYAFANCSRLTDVELSEQLETISGSAFEGCVNLQRITIPLKEHLLDCRAQFDFCNNLATINVVEGIHKTFASLHMEEWRHEMSEEISRINMCLDGIDVGRSPRAKSQVIKWWLQSIVHKMDHYKAEHCRYVKEAISLLELALWKTKLVGETETSSVEIERQTKKVKVDGKIARKEMHLMCCADIVIKNVLPFLQLA